MQSEQRDPVELTAARLQVQSKALITHYLAGSYPRLRLIFMRLGEAEIMIDLF